MPKGRKIEGNVTNPLINMAQGENGEFILSTLAVRDLGKEKVDLHSYDAVYDRITAYFNLMVQADKRPTWTGLCMALGYTRDNIWKIEHNMPYGNSRQAEWRGHKDSGIPEEVRNLICETHEVMTSLWEDYMQNGKVHPACGIFIGKNFYGMKDVVENVVKAEGNPLDGYNAEDIASRYIPERSQAEVPPKKRKPKSNS